MGGRWDYFPPGEMPEIGLKILKCNPDMTMDTTIYDIKYICHDSNKVIQLSHAVINNKLRHKKALCVQCAAKLRGMLAKQNREKRKKEKAELAEEEERRRSILMQKNRSGNYQAWKKAMLRISNNAA